MSEQKQVQSNRLVNYFKLAIEELKKVKWPTGKETINHTFLVIVICVVMAIFLGLLDFGLTEVLYKFLIK